MGLSKGGLSGGGLAKGGLKLVSVSRVSPSREKEAQKAHEREHGANEGTARQHRFKVVGRLSFCESALLTDRGAEILAKCELEDACGIVVPTLRRFAVGLAQISLREQLEDVGLLILSGRDKETALLRDKPGHLRNAELMKVAADDYLDWAGTNAKWQRRSPSQIPAYWTTPEGLATIAFIEERDHLKTRRLAAILEAHGYLTPEGKSTWYPAQVSRARAYGEALSGSEAFRNGRSARYSAAPQTGVQGVLGAS